MQSVRIEPLEMQQFWPFGVFSQQIDPQVEKIGAVPIEFFRDMTQLDLGRATRASFSTCRVAPRPLVIDTLEYHSETGEGILPLDQDVLIHVAPATPACTRPPLDKLHVFRVPRGTFVALRPGTWHHAPYATTDEPANILIVLPERTYANDCFVFELPPADQVAIAPLEFAPALS